ncbi:MAG: hypothetical protein ACFB6R_12270 [Alphaproteobacteria bacterium]
MAPVPPRIDPEVDARLKDLACDPALYPFRFDPLHRTILFLLADPALFRQASFLDERMVPTGSKGGWVSLDRIKAILASVSAADRAVRRPLHFIFHTSHCGSTLLSRLLDQDQRVLSLREPLPLRDLAVLFDDLDTDHALWSGGDFDSLVETFGALWSRAPARVEAVTVKATSATQRLAPALLSAWSGAKAIAISLKPEPHIATLLAGPNNLTDMKAWGRERMIRLVRLAGPAPSPLHTLSPGEWAAFTWAAERLTQRDWFADETLAPRLLDIDFDDLLAQPGAVMGRVFHHIGVTPDTDYLARIAQTPAISQYAKAPEHAYGPGLRAEVLRTARREQAVEIAKGLNWLERYAAGAPVLEKALNAEGFGREPSVLVP